MTTRRQPRVVPAGSMDRTKPAVPALIHIGANWPSSFAMYDRSRVAITAAPCRRSFISMVCPFERCWTHQCRHLPADRAGGPGFVLFDLAHLARPGAIAAPISVGLARAAHAFLRATLAGGQDDFVGHPEVEVAV